MKISMSMNRYIALLSMISNLALDPCIALLARNSGEVELSIDLAIVASECYGVPRIQPLISVEGGFRLHFKHQFLSYLGTKLLSLGSFLTGRGVSKEFVAEVAEEATLIPHLDARHRRAVYLRRSHSVTIDSSFWYLPIALVAGVHRWGISWRRIIASTYAMHLHALNRNPRDEELDLITLSFVEAAYSARLYRTMLREVGEEFYALVTQPIEGIYDWADDVLRELEQSSSLEGKVSKLAYELLRGVARFRDTVKEGIAKLVKLLEKPTPGVRGPQFVGVYANNVNYSIRMFETLRGKGKSAESCLYLLFATETWSPYNIYALSRLFVEYGGDTLKLLVLFTPQTLPQVLFSILTLPVEDGVQLVDSDTYLRPLCTLCTRCDEPFRCIDLCITTRIDGTTKKCKLVLYLAPLVGKTPSIVYTELKALLKYLAKSMGVNTVVTHAAFTGIASVTSSLVKLEKEKLDGLNIVITS